MRFHLANSHIAVAASEIPLQVLKIFAGACYHEGYVAGAKEAVALRQFAVLASKADNVDGNGMSCHVPKP